jgi:hypothetical protein
MMKRVTTLCFLTIAALTFSGAGIAADSSNSGNDQQQTQKLMQEYRQDAQQLKQIHEKTIKANPQLAKEQNQFQTQVKKAVKKNGYNVEQGQKRMQAMAKKLQSKNTSDDEKSATMKKFQAERQKMLKARDAALQDPAIQKSGKQLEQDTITAMKKQNSKTGELLSDMQSTRNKLQASMPQQSNSK